ncbi:uncharacterized protein PRD47_004467 [Ara ararauna]
MDGFLASRSFRRSGKLLDRKSSLLFTPSLTSTRRAKLSICHNSSPDSAFPSSHSLCASADPPPAHSFQHRASTGHDWRGFRGGGDCHPSSPAGGLPAGDRVPLRREMPMGVPAAAWGEPPAPRPGWLPAWGGPIPLPRLLLAFFYVSACRYKGGFVTPPVCKNRGPWLTFRKTDCNCLLTARPYCTGHRGRVIASVTGSEGSHGSTAKGLLAACLPRNASCELLFSGERGGRWRGGLTLSLRAASRLAAARSEPRAALRWPPRGPGRPRQGQGPGRELVRDKLPLSHVMVRNGDCLFYAFIIIFYTGLEEDAAGSCLLRLLV